MPSIRTTSNGENTEAVGVIESSNNTSQTIIKNLTKTFGDSGTQRYSGFFLEEPNSQWRDEQRVDIVEEMRRSDGAIKAVLNAIKAPMLAAEWYIEAQDEKMKKFVDDNLFHMKRTWKDFQREAFSYMDFGHYCFELIFEKNKQGGFTLSDLAPRIPRSILKWEISDGKPGITQILRTNDSEIEGSMAEIPLSKLLVLTNDKEGDDITGQSILRAAYKHYKYKDILYRIQGIAAERWGVGIPVVILPSNYSTEEGAKAEEMARNMKSNEKAYIILPKDWEVKILTPTGNPEGTSIESAIQHHSTQILMSVLASFLGLGSGNTGSFALSKDQSSFFIKHVEDKCNYFCEQITEQVIKRLVYINFGKDVEVPRLRFQPLGDINFQEMSTVLKNLSDTGFIDPQNTNMKEFTRKMFKLPEMTEEEKQAEEERQQEEELKGLEEDMKNDEMSFVDDEDAFNQNDDVKEGEEVDDTDNTDIEGDDAPAAKEANKQAEE